MQQEVLPRGPRGGGAQRERGRARGAGVLLALLPPRLPHPLPQDAALRGWEEVPRLRQADISREVARHPGARRGQVSGHWTEIRLEIER